MKNTFFKGLLNVGIIALCAVLVFVAIIVIALPRPEQYVTTDTAEYGNYIGNYDNETVQSFITSFFPNTLEPIFSDITYSYRAQKFDTYAYEAYLEFTIENPAVFQSYVAQYKDLATTKFPYDDSFYEHTIADEFDPVGTSTTVGSTDSVSISWAKIGKVLISYEQQRIIYVALGVYDGGGARTDFLCVYFNRFNIDPLSYGNLYGS